MPSESPAQHGTPRTAASPNSTRAMAENLQIEAMELQREMERIKERRRQLEEQKRRLLTSSSKLQTPSSINRTATSSRRSNSAMSVRHWDATTPIPSEHERRQMEQRNIYREMKEAIKASWDVDTTTVGGYFLLKDNNSVCTFGREKRFTPIVGQTGQYYLGTDQTLMEQTAKGKHKQTFGLHNRGRTGCNVNSHWNDSTGGCAPGPGAYTPRWQKITHGPKRANF